jgi:Domain of unknown function (DUF4123)
VQLELVQTIMGRRPEYVLVDAAQDGQILGFLARGKTDWRSLYQGDTAYQLASYAPYLVAVPDSEEWIAELLNKGWGRSWLIFVCSLSPIDDVRLHFRHFLYVQDSNGQQLYFRFYDPRVLRAFLAASTPSELKEFFGPVTEFILEGDEPADLCVLSLSDDGRLINRTAKVSLDSAGCTANAVADLPK